MSAASPPSTRRGDRRRPHHHRRLRISDRSARVCPRCASASSARASSTPRRRELAVARARRARGRAARRCASTASPARPAFVDIAAPFATGLHQVDNPVFDRDGNLYVTYSGTRGQQVPVSIFRVRPNGTRETFSSGIVNPTSMAIDAGRPAVRVEPVRGHRLSRVGRTASAEPFATDLGVACGLAFARRRHALCRRSLRHDLPGRPRRAGRRRSRRCRRASRRFTWRSAPDGALYVTGPTLSPYDAVYRIDAGRHGRRRATPAFGRPQGLAFDRARHAVRRRGAGRRERPVSAAGRRRARARARRARPGRRRVRSARRARRLLERHGVSAGAGPAEAWTLAHSAVASAFRRTSGAARCACSRTRSRSPAPRAATAPNRTQVIHGRPSIR